MQGDEFFLWQNKVQGCPTLLQGYLFVTHRPSHLHLTVISLGRGLRFISGTITPFSQIHPFKVGSTMS